MKHLLWVAPILFLHACASLPSNYTPEVEYISQPELGVVWSTPVGGKILTQGKLTTRRGISLNPPSIFTGFYKLSEGFYPEVGEDEDNKYYSFIKGDGKNSLDGFGTVKKDLIADPVKNIQISKRNGRFCLVTILNTLSCMKGVGFREDERIDKDVDSFLQTLTYSGIVGDKINIGYREFSSSAARPAFGNDVEYDLSIDNIIAYKGAEIKVIEANNKKITYIVNKNFK
jgi:hypothetical protein